MDRKLRIIVAGLAGLYPIGGVAWDYLQYAIGLAHLGHDVYYTEDTWSWPYDPVANSRTQSPAYSVSFLERFFKQYAPELANRWHYRHLHGESYGMSHSSFDAIASSADLFINVSGANPIPERCSSACVKLFVDTDPGYNQAVLTERFPWSENVHRWSESVLAHDIFATYAENIHAVDCLVPDVGIDWITTRMPIVLSLWPQTPSVGAETAWSTVMTWNAFAGPVEVDGVVYGSKGTEFPLIEKLPSRSTSRFEVALGGQDAPVARLRDLGWDVRDGPRATLTPGDYQDLIRRSRGEVSIAKHIYVAMRTGWFSCRSACYLATGRPVLVQDTGFSSNLPTGAGLVAFSSFEEAVSGLHELEGNYAFHADAARDIARECFDANTVLTSLLEDVMCGQKRASGTR